MELNYQDAMKKVKKMDLVKVHILATDAGRKLPDKEKQRIIEKRVVDIKALYYITKIEKAAVQRLLIDDPGGLIDTWYL